MSVSAEITSTSERQTRAVARRLAARLQGGDVVALHGPLGAGKTCFVRGLAEGLGLDPHAVSSPTFVLCQEYPRGPVGLALAHLDGYRLASDDELETLGWDELLEAPDTVIAVEWAERFGARLPPRRITLELAHHGVESRTIAIRVPEELAARIDPATVARPLTIGS